MFFYIVGVFVDLLWVWLDGYFVVVVVEGLWAFLLGFCLLVFFPKNPSVLLLSDAGKQAPTMTESLGTGELSNTLIRKPCILH